jgi:hypothetical protein
MSTFVLVHGAWHGGWCWSKVKHALEAATSTVYTPTLTGLGERVHLASPEIGLETHIEDVVRLIEYELLTDVILVGIPGRSCSQEQAVSFRLYWSGVP